MGQLDGQTAIVTGGGTGIGLCVAQRFHKEGAFVVICGRSEDKLQQAVPQIAAGGERVLGVRANIISEDDVSNLVAQAVAATGRLDILVNNAAAMRCNKPPEETSLAEWEEVMDTNVTGPFLCCREAGKVMIKQGGGRIINVASISGQIVNRHVHGGSYDVSKAALLHLTKALAVEWAQHNIKVNSVAPGYYATQPNLDFFARDPELEGKILDMIPVGKLGNLDELSNLILYMALPSTEYLTGSTITIDGGYTIW